MSYKQEAIKKGYNLKPDSPIFVAYWNKGKITPLTIKGINNLFDDFSLDAFGDLEIKRFSPHDTREFFQSALENAGVQANIISPIMAHKIKGVDAHYSSHDFKELLIKYESALPYLIPKSIGELEAEVQQRTKENEQQQKAIDVIKEEHKKENEEQNAKIANMENQFKEFVNLIRDGKLHVVTKDDKQQVAYEENNPKKDKLFVDLKKNQQ